MSRIGKIPVAVPAGVDIKIDGELLTVKGPKGTFTHTVASPITVEKSEQGLEVKRPNDERISKSLHGLTRTLVANMVTGVTDGYEKKLEIVGTGYRVALKGRTSSSHSASRTPWSSRRRPASPLLSRAPPSSRWLASTSSRWVRSRPTFARFASLSRTRARVSATRASRFAARPERRVSSHGSRN